jgi:hypothetical protein
MPDFKQKSVKVRNLIQILGEKGNNLELLGKSLPFSTFSNDNRNFKRA